MNDSNFSATLLQCRRNAGLTQKKVADELGIHRSAYAYYETSSKCTLPNCCTVIKLSEILGVSYAVLMDALASDMKSESKET